MRGIQRGVTTSLFVLVILASTIIITTVYLASYKSQKQKQTAINSFEDCAKLYPVMESYPEQCNTPDGKHFTRQLSEEEKQRTVSPEEILEKSKKVSDWKTYTNTQDKYSINYPTALFTNCGGEEEFFLFEGGEGTRECALGEEPTQFYITKNSSEQKFYQHSSNPQCYSITKEPISVSGTAGFKYYAVVKSRTGECGNIDVAYAGAGTNIDLEYKGDSYSLYYFNGVAMSVINRMLDSFKILE